MKRVALFGLLVSISGGCGDNIRPAVGDIDAAIDAAIDPDSAPDARPDAPIDAPIGRPAPRYTGAIGFLETAVLRADGTQFGQGIQANITFFDNTLLPPPLFEEQTGPFGCKVWRYNIAETVQATIGIDQGGVEITDTSSGNLVLAECAYEPAVGYRCPDPASAGTTGIIAASATASRVTLTDASSRFSMASVGSHVRISGATFAANNGLFPIVAGTTDSITYVNADFVAESPSARVTHVNLAGVGAISGVADPGFLANGAELDITHTMGGGSNAFIPTFSAVTDIGDSVGDDFALTAPANLNAVPRNGSAFTLACDAANCPSSSAAMTRIDLVTTDGSLAGQSAYAMPPPSDKRVHVQCTTMSIAAGASIMVPAAYMEQIAASGATRIQATFTRATVLIDAPIEVEVLAGHSVVGYTN